MKCGVVCEVWRTRCVTKINVRFNCYIGVRRNKKYYKEVLNRDLRKIHFNPSMYVSDLKRFINYYYFIDKIGYQ